MSGVARSSNTTWAKAAQKPDPTAVVAKTEGDYHLKAENLRRTNEKLDAIEQCITTDIGAEVEIRQSIAEYQQVINDARQKKAELDEVILQAEEAMEKGEEEMRKSNAQRRRNHFVELRQLVKEQATGFEKLKKSEVAHHAELTQKIEGYKMKDESAPSYQSLPSNNADELDSSEDEDCDGCPSVDAAIASSSGKSANEGRTARPATYSRFFGGNGIDKRQTEVGPDNAKRMCKEAPSKRK